MINKVRLTCVGNEGCDVNKATQQAYPCTYEYNGRVRMITDSGLYKEFGPYESNRPKALLLNFSRTVMFHDYEYETEVDKQTQKDKEVLFIIEKFWKSNPLTLVNGNTHHNSKVSQYNLSDSNTQTMSSATRFKDVLRASNKISDMTHAQRCDVAFYYGESPVGKTEEELLVSLANPEGKCLSISNIENFLRVWVDGKSDDRDVLVVLKKAVTFGVIADKKFEGRSNYYLGESFMGVDEPGLLDWSRKHPRDYSEHIEREVKARDKKESIGEKSLGKQKVFDVNKLDEMRRQAKELIVEGFIDEKAHPNTNIMGIEKLKVIIEAALEKKNSVTI